MSVKLDVEAGTATVELPGEKGLTFVYDVRPVPPVGGWRSWAVERQDDPEAEHAHTVGRDGQRWRCTCRDHYYRGRLRLCKHAAAVKLALEALAKLTGVEA